MKPLALSRTFGTKFIALLLALALPAFGQEVTVRDLCNRVQQIQVAKIEVDKPEPVKIEVDKPAPSKIEVTMPDMSNKSDVKEVAEAKSEALSTEITNDRCVQASPIGFHYAPKINAMIHRQYEDSLNNAKGVTEIAKVSRVVLNAEVDVTTPPGFFYRNGNFVIGRYDTLEQCMQVRQHAGNVGICGPHEGPILISITGVIGNRNQFPLRSVSIQCHYVSAHDVPKSFEVQFVDIFGKGGAIPYEEKIIAQLPPHSIVKNISCKAKEAEIWQPTDNIQTLSAPFQP
jgi:hypothetical protein